MTATAIPVPIEVTGYRLSGLILPKYVDDAQLREKWWIKHALTLTERNNLTGNNALVWAGLSCLAATSYRNASALCAIK